MTSPGPSGGSNGHANGGVSKNGHAAGGVPKNGHGEGGVPKDGHGEGGVPKDGHGEGGVPKDGHGEGEAGALTLTKADFQSDQETRWCPGCGDYAVLSAVQQFMPELGIAPERIVFITGIGCAGRFAYYMDTYGMHGIHGRAPALATGLAATREDLSIWVITGDGDALSIGGNHLIHALRRNVPVKILLFNNQIYGLTKGQASPTSELGKITKSTPFGVADQPFNPVALALGAEATFVARTIDRDRRHLTDVLRAAAEHPGAALVEIYQNCPVFNDGAFSALTEKDTKELNQIRLQAGEPIRFGPDGGQGVARAADGGLEIVDVEEVGEDALIIHDPGRTDPGLAFSLARLADDPTQPTPIGIFRAVECPVYGRGDAVRGEPAAETELEELLLRGDTWTVS
jgi:2-oxoglutarate ferredoxin oxidoreductase subunit beta